MCRCMCRPRSESKNQERGRGRVGTHEVGIVLVVDREEVGDHFGVLDEMGKEEVSDPKEDPA